VSTYVGIGCNSIRDYNFIAPMTALLWRERIGFNPIVLRCDEWLASPRSAVAAKALEEHRIPQAILNPLEGYESHTLAQNCREFAACLPLPPDAWLMPADADLWPIMKSFYQKHQDGQHKAVCYYGNGDHYQTLPTCHVTMQVATWRKLYGIKEGDLIHKAVQAALDAWTPTYRERWPWTERNFAVWMSDQAILTEKVRELPEAEVKMVERAGHPPADRIDRTHWRDVRPDDVDAHVLRAPDEPANWPRILELFKALLPEYGSWAENYREEYWRAYR
jgi:hypothetical protein